jgi:DhnA family fructose-bisphosphate aldolase class Ia
MTDFDKGDPRRYEHLAHIRLTDPDAIARAAAKRAKHPGMGRDQILLIAADHPARAALAVGKDEFAMADRLDLLDRMRAALARPGVSGVLASPDIIDDLLLTGDLDGKLVFGTMNRGGLRASTFEFEDRMTAYTPEALRALGADGGKTLTRICLEDPGSVRTLQWTSEAITGLAEQGLYAMVEPFWSHWEDGRVVHDLTPEGVMLSIEVASALGATSARTILKIPVVDEMERVMSATTLPTVLLGGDPSGSPDETYASWQAALRLPGVIGLTLGRTMLYPPDDDVAKAVDTAASLLHKSV